MFLAYGVLYIWAILDERRECEPEQYCPECGCMIGDKIYESEGVLYCCESCANGDACECENCAQIVEEDEDEE